MDESGRPTPEALLDTILSELLERWPATTEVFHNHAMACAGCAVAAFYTVRDAALVYRLVPETFAAELAAAIDAARG